MFLFSFWNMFPFPHENERAASRYWLSLKFLSSLPIIKTQLEGRPW